MTAQPFYCLELQFDVDLEKVTNEKEALAFTETFLPDLYRVIKRHAEGGASIHVSFKLNHEILEYEWVDGVDRTEEQEQAADNFVERVRAAQEKINAGY